MPFYQTTGVAALTTTTTTAAKNAFERITRGAFFDKGSVCMCACLYLCVKVLVVLGVYCFREKWSVSFSGCHCLIPHPSGCLSVWEVFVFRRLRFRIGANGGLAARAPAQGSKGKIPKVNTRCKTYTFFFVRSYLSVLLCLSSVD